MRTTLTRLRAARPRQQDVDELPRASAGSSTARATGRAGAGASSRRSSGSSGAPSATTGSCSRRRKRFQESRRPLLRRSSPPARRTTAPPPSAASTTACAGRSSSVRRGLPSEAEFSVSVAAQELRDALAEALGAEARVSDGDSERDLHARGHHLPPAAATRPRRLSGLDRRRLAGPRDSRTSGTGRRDAVRRRLEPRRPCDPDARRHQPRPLAPDRIVEIAPGDLTATVQAGVTRIALERAAGEHGLFFPVDPGADATLGGMAATNAAGTTTIRYGKMRANVLALEAVLADGTIVRTGSRAPKTSAGYDLTSLLVGSEGTLAVITEVRVRLLRRSRSTSSRSASRSRRSTRRAGPPRPPSPPGAAVTRLELLDAWTLAAINAYRGSSYPEGPCLLVEAAGTEATVEADLQLVRELAEAEGATEIVDERDADAPRAPLGGAARRGLRGRRGLARAGTSARRTRAFRSPSWPGAVAFARAEVERLGPRRGDPRPRRRRQRPRQPPGRPRRSRPSWRSRTSSSTASVADALARGGTCTGEHGIGLGKIARARARARRPGPADARDQASLRPERDPQSRQGLHRREER